MLHTNSQKEKRLKISEALHQCLLKKPFDQTSIKEIAAEANVAPGLLHYYYKSKEDILLHYIDFVIDTYQSSFNKWLQTRGKSYKSSHDFLRGAFDFVIHKITLKKDLSKIFIEISEIAIYNPKVKEKLCEAYLRWATIIEETITVFDIDKNAASHLSMGIIAFLEGISLFSVLFDSSQIDFEAILKEFQRRFLE